VKVQATPNVNLAALRLSVTADWDRLAVDYICKTCCSFRRSLEAVIVQNGVYAE
jgi:hypothetical protein